MKKVFRELSPSDQLKLMIFPFWGFVMFLSQMFYPVTVYPIYPYTAADDGPNKFGTAFFILFSACVLTIVTIWIFAFVEYVLRDKSQIIYPNLPYDLFYHYKPKGYTMTGYIYLVKRLADGVYKIGKASNLENRVDSLRREYGPIAIIAVWEVPDCVACERVALESTRQITHHELGRQELRAMDDWQCWKFIEDFTRYVAGLEGLMPEVENNDQLPMPTMWGES